MLVTSGIVAQQADPASRLSGRLPADLEEGVLERIAAAQSQGLPSGSLVDLALQGVVKGRSDDEILTALEGYLVTLSDARVALGGPDAQVPSSEVEAAGLALRMGADAGAVADLARSRPAGRSLRVPLLVLGSLSQRDLPSDQALSRVLQGLAARLDDAALLAGMPGAATRGGPPGVPASGPLSPGTGTPAGLHGPPGGLPVPVGPAGGRRPGPPPGTGPPDGVPGHANPGN